MGVSQSRSRKSIKFIDVDSFVSYFNEYKVGMSPKMFMERTLNGIGIMAVFDYDTPTVYIHEEGKKTQTIAPIPQWNDHVVHLSMKHHPDYQTLLDNSNKWHEQYDFALFIEENTHLFTNPDAATMLEMAQHLKGTVNAQWRSGQRLANNQTSIEYTEEIKAQTYKGDITVPEYIDLQTPLYEGFSSEPIRAAFRFRS